MSKAPLEDLFENRVLYPDGPCRARLSRLEGLDDHRSRLTKILSLLVNPAGLQQWADKHYGKTNKLLEVVRNRPPLVILAGDVGSGKTELAECIGDEVARQENIDVTLLPLSLSTRGQGRVGEMTQLLSAAFDYTISEATKYKGTSSKARGAVLLLVDEADALAQSREAAQMHHEDRAGVNTFIRGISRIGNANIPAAVIMCTNRYESLDPAVKRRAAEILIFQRPNPEQRRIVLELTLKELGFSDSEIETIVKITGPQTSHGYGFTFSDLTQRLLPRIILDAYPNNPVKPSRAIELARSIVPTPPFKEEVR